MNNFVIKGNICYSGENRELHIVENGYAVCENGTCAGVFEQLPACYETYLCYDYTDRLVIPGLTDLHLHAPQYSFRGLGMDLELLDWLNTRAFTEEMKYSDLAYAERAYDIFADDVRHSATTRVCVFGTLHTEATLRLMEKLERAGVCGYVGKVNMDRNSPETLCETSAQQSYLDTKDWLERSAAFQHIRPVLTPRFIPSCSDELMEKLSELQKQYHLPVQSHMSENLSEIEWVKELSGTEFYGQAYDKYGMFGNDCPTVMAHCVHSGEEEMELMRKQGVFVAHCPESNANLSSGIAPVRRYLERGMKIGLGSDVAAGSSLSMFRAMAMAVQCSKLYWRLVDQSLKPLKLEDVFYMATRGGGEFFGKVGSFEKGFAFDAVVMDDRTIRQAQPLGVRDRLERLMYLADDRHVAAKIVDGNICYMN